MKKYIYSMAFLFSLVLTASSDSGEEKPQEKEQKSYSQPVTYVVGIVTRGENWQQDSARAFELQEKHLKFLEELVASKKLMASGPLKSNTDARGLYVYNVKTIKEAQALVAEDEAVSSGWIAMDFHVWDSRDYTVPEPAAMKKEVEDEESKEANWGLRSMSITFAVVLLIIILRTFRYKASV